MADTDTIDFEKTLKHHASGVVVLEARKEHRKYNTPRSLESLHEARALARLGNLMPKKGTKEGS